MQRNQPTGSKVDMPETCVRACAHTISTVHFSHPYTGRSIGIMSQKKKTLQFNLWSPNFTQLQFKQVISPTKLEEEQIC